MDGAFWIAAAPDDGERLETALRALDLLLDGCANAEALFGKRRTQRCMERLAWRLACPAPRNPTPPPPLPARLLPLLFKDNFV